MQFIVDTQIVEVALDRVADFGHRFFARLALGDASRDRGTFGYKHPILIRRDDDSEFHMLYI